MTHENAVVPRPFRNVFPIRTPLALKNENLRTVMTALLPSRANQELPEPSSPAGHKMLETLSNPDSVVDGEASICAFCRGTGTSEDENGVAPDEKGTFGLLVLLIEIVPLPKEVTNDPAKNKLECDELVVIESTSAFEPDSPPNGGADQDEEATSQTATERAGEVKLPPAHTFFALVSQNKAFTSPFGPFEPRAATPDEDVYEATLLAEVLPIEEKEPAK